MWLFTVLCVLLPSLAAAEIYKYPDGQGGVVFKSEPCEWQCEEPTPAPAPKPAPTTKQSRPPIQPAQVPPEESSPASSRVSPPSESSPPPSGPSSLAQKQQEMRGLILPIQPTEATCTQLGQSAETFAILRDRGTPARDLISQFTAAATKTPGAVWEFSHSIGFRGKAPQPS